MKQVMAMMASIDLDVLQPALKKDAVSRGEVSGIIGMVGPQVRGSMAISLEKDLSFAMMKNMLAEDVQELNDSVCDMVGEITNMICGSAKGHLSEQGYEFEMATPVIVSGVEHLIQHKVEGPKIILPFSSSQGNAYLEICFDG